MVDIPLDKDDEDEDRPSSVTDSLRDNETRDARQIRLGSNQSRRDSEPLRSEATAAMGRKFRSFSISLDQNIEVIK